MGVGSTLEVIGGQPRMLGHRLSVAHVVSGIKELGLEEYGKKYFSQIELKKEHQKVKRLLDYCSQQRCVLEAIRPCLGCIQNKPTNPDLSKAAYELRKEYFEDGLRRIDV